MNLRGTWSREYKLAHRGVLLVKPDGGMLLLRSFHPEIVVSKTETKPESREARVLKEIFECLMFSTL